MWLALLWGVALVVGVGYLVYRWGSGGWADVSDLFDGDGDDGGGGCGGCGD